MKKAVVIDDDAVTRAVLSRLLADQGFNVLTAAEGEAGLELAVREIPDLVLTDFLLPRLDGIGVCQSIRRSPGLENVRVVILTALTNISLLREARNSGADDVLQKPIGPDGLYALLGRLGLGDGPGPASNSNPPL